MDNVTMDSNRTENEIAYNAEIWKFILPIQLLIFLAALFGNIMVCIVGYRLRQTLNVGDSNMYVLIICLATSDLGMALFFMPISIFITLFPDYELPVFICMLNYFPMKYLLGVQLILLMSLSLDRYYIICTYREKKLNLTVSLLCTYIIPLAIQGFSIALWYECKVVPELTLCYINWKNEDELFQIMDMSLVCGLVVISLSVVTVSYSSTFWAIKKATKACIKSGVGVQIKSLNRQRRVTIMLLTCVILFWVCWAPAAVFNVAMASSLNIEVKYTNEAVSKLVVWLLCVNSACNPMVYAFGSRQYRKELYAVLNRLKCIKTKPHPNVGQSYVVETVSMDPAYVRKNESSFRYLT